MYYMYMLKNNYIYNIIYIHYMGTVCKLMVLSNALRCSLSLDGFTSD